VAITKEEVLNLIENEFDVRAFCEHIYDALQRAQQEAPGAEEYDISPLTLHQYIAGLHDAFDHEAIAYWQSITWFTKEG